MKRKLPKITKIALLIYVVVAPLSLLFSHEPLVKVNQYIGTNSGIRVEGQLYFLRGLKLDSDFGNKAIVYGVADFTYESGEDSISDLEVEEVVKSGAVPHGEITWHVHWGGLAMRFIPFWIVVWLVFWIRSENRERNHVKDD